MMEESLKIAFQLAQLVAFFDEEIFGKESVKEIRVIKKVPKRLENGTIAGDWVQYIPELDIYKIDGYLEEVLPKLMSTARHAIILREEDIETGEIRIKFSPFTIEEFLIAVAAHEVRHRVQHKTKITQFSIGDSKKAKDPQLKMRLEFGEIYFRKYHEPEPREDVGREFDAQIVEYLAPLS